MPKACRPLERIARVLSDDVWVVAPEYEQSGVSRSLTLTEPLRVRRLDARRFAVTGTPTDCVLLARPGADRGRPARPGAVGGSTTVRTWPRT